MHAGAMATNEIINWVKLKMIRFLEIGSAKLNLRSEDGYSESSECKGQDTFEEVVPLEARSESGKGQVGECHGFSTQFQHSVKQALAKCPRDQEPNFSFPTPERKFQFEKISIQVPESLIRFGADLDEGKNIALDNATSHVVRKVVPPEAIQETATLKCAMWINQQFGAKAISPQVVAAWKKEKNVVVASQRVKSPHPAPQPKE